MKALSRNKKKQVSLGQNCVKPHWSFVTISLCLCGAMDWMFDYRDGERGESQVKTYNLQLSTTLMVSIYQIKRKEQNKTVKYNGKRKKSKHI